MSSIEFPQSSQPIGGAESISSSEGTSENKTKVDPGQSTIEESQLVAALLIPLVSVPALIPPSQNYVEGLGLILASMSERKKMDFLFSMANQIGEATSTLNQIFIESLEKIIEETRQILNSTPYKNEQENRRANHASTEKVDEISSGTATGSKNRVQSIEEELTNASRGIANLSHDVKGIEKLEIPFAVLFTVAGTLALGEVNSSNESANDILKLIEKIHPLVPEVKIEQIAPLINLMVMAPIIFRPLDEGIQNQAGHQRANYAKLVQNFAKDVIKMVTDPTFALLNIINNIEEMDHLNSEQRDKFIALLKLILSSVALSLMYSLEVGKIHGEKFLGMEPLEFKALLNPEQPLLKQKPEKEMSINEKLTHSLINQIRLQLSHLPSEGRAEAIDAILDFLKQSHRIGKLLDPSKVLTDVLESMNYKMPLRPEIQV